MTSALDMSLDDIIKSNKRSSSRGRGGGGRGSGLGPARHTFKRGVNKTAPYSKVTIFFKKQKKKEKKRKFQRCFVFEITLILGLDVSLSI